MASRKKKDTLEQLCRKARDTSKQDVTVKLTFYQPDDNELRSEIEAELSFSDGTCHSVIEGDTLDECVQGLSEQVSWEERRHGVVAEARRMVEDFLSRQRDKGLRDADLISSLEEAMKPIRLME